MFNKSSETVIDFCAHIFGNQEYRELGKEKSEWFKKIFDSLDNDEPGFLEFVLMCELRYGELIAKEDLIPTTSLLLIKYNKKKKEKRKNATLDFFNSNELDECCKEVYYTIKGTAENGNS